MKTNEIPGLQVENIGTRKKPHQVIKGFIELPCWNGYFLTEKPNYLIKTNVVTDGRIELWVNGTIGDNGRYAVDPEQSNCYFFLAKHQDRIKQSILDALKNRFPDLLSSEYASWDHEDDSLPKITELTPAFDFEDYIGPSSISIEEDIKDEMAYAKWHFQCRWDPEHGFEVITHKDRVIDLAPETDIFKINQDNGTYNELENELRNKEWKVPLKKKWWRFW